MKHATRIGRLAHQASGVVISLAHGAVLSVGLMGMAAVAVDGGALGNTTVSYSDARATVPDQPTTAEAAMAAAALDRVRPAPQLVSLPADVVPPRPASAAALFAGDDDELSPEMARVRDWIAGTYRVSDKTLVPALTAAEAFAEEMGFDPLLIVAIMAVESSFNARAVSNMGAQGLMQVIPHYHRDKIGRNGGKNALFDPHLNVRVGVQVLQEGLQRYGSMQRALQYYNGSLKDPQARYTRKVMALKKRLLAAAGRDTTLARTQGEVAG